MSEAELFLNILKSLDSFAALLVAVWVIRIGIERMDRLQDQHNEMTKTVLGQQQTNNTELMSLVSSLCIQPSQRSDAPKSVKRVAEASGLPT